MQSFGSETAAHVAGAHASNRMQGNASENFAPAFASDTAKAGGAPHEIWITLARETPVLTQGRRNDEAEGFGPTL